MEEKDLAAQCYKMMYEGMIAKDREMLERVLDEAFVLTHMTGMQQGREEYIRGIEQGTLNYYSAEHELIQVSICGDVATLIGRSRVSAAVFGGGRHTWRLQLKSSINNRDGRWYIGKTTASTY